MKKKTLLTFSNVVPEKILSICVMNFNETGFNVSQSISIARKLDIFTHLHWEKREKEEEKKISKRLSVIISRERRNVPIRKIKGTFIEMIQIMFRN